MSSTQEGSSENGRNKKTEKSRRIWSTKEEEILMAAMKELIVTGWKSDNGFRSGYLNKLEAAMNKAFPNTDLKGMPHINSKLSSWKKNYNSLTSMLSRSGVGWNLNGNFTVDCTNDQWELIVKLDNNARTMRFKSWPLYDEWKEIFGKDRATGEAVEDITDAFYDMLREEHVPDHKETGGDYHVNLDDINIDEADGESASHGRRAHESPKQKEKKRKVKDDISTDCVHVLAEIGRETNARLENLAARIGYEFDLGKARKDAFEELGRIPGLSLDQKLDVYAMLCEKVDKLEMFMALPDEARSRFVMRFLME